MKKLFKGATFYILLFVLIVSMINLLGSPAQEVQQLSFSEFYTKLQSEQITELTIMENKVTGKLKKDNAEFSTLIPYAINNDKLTEIILAQTETGALKVTGQDPPQPSWIISMLPTLLMLLVMVGVWYMFMQQFSRFHQGVIISRISVRSLQENTFRTAEIPGYFLDIRLDFLNASLPELRVLKIGTEQAGVM